MQTTLQIIHIIAGLIVVSEALNKLERTTPFAAGISAHKRLVDGLKALAWVLLALGAGGAVATPLLHSLGLPDAPWDHISNSVPTLAETAVLLGFAVLTVRARVMEG